MKKDNLQQGRLSTGFSGIDKLTTGLVDGSLVVIAGRPAMGKTSLALDIAKHPEGNSKKQVVFFSLEMSEDRLRMWLRKKGVSAQGRDTNLLIIDDPTMTVKKMRGICEKIGGLGAVIIDYVQLINGDEDVPQTDTRQMEMCRISRELKLMAQTLNVPVICLSQLSRACLYRQDKHPILTDFSHSASLAEEADQILLLYRESYDNPDTPQQITECIVAKNRYGETGTARLRWISEYLKFVDE